MTLLPLQQDVFCKEDPHHSYLEQLPTSKGGQVEFWVMQHFRTKGE